MNTSAFDFYSQSSVRFSDELSVVSKKLKRFAWYRFFSFLLIFLPFFIFEMKSWQTAVLSLAAIVFFFFLVKKNIHLEKRIKELRSLKTICDDEILALKHSFLQFQNGAEFLDKAHPFSYDLDLFGEGSLFQFINRTSTICGRQKLAGWLINPTLSKTIIEKKQDAVRELAKLREWRLNFLSKGNLFEETIEMNHEISSWAQLELKIKNPVLLKWALWVVPLITVASIIPWAIGISGFFLFVSVFAQWIFIYFFWKKINEYFNFFGRKSELLGKYMQLLEYIEKQEFRSENMNDLLRKISEPVSAGEVFKQLKIRVKELEYRQNILVGFFLNSLFLWDIRCVYRLWRWHTENRTKLHVWLDTVSEIDALVSIANYSDNHPGFEFPEIRDEEFVLDAKNIGHPLLKPEKRICSDFEIKGWGKSIIVTGANMAGKSTFLRTVGVNLVLTSMGAPVCAEKMVVKPVVLFTNMRTTDSLIKDESYFFAELKRLKQILQHLQAGEPVFVILDEMLKGTNSVDKLNGSKQLVQKLIQYKSVSLIATHDLKLSEMETEFPQQISNKCFEIRIENNELIFDYRLYDGVTQTMNATFLMKKMGII